MGVEPTSSAGDRDLNGRGSGHELERIIMVICISQGSICTRRKKLALEMLRWVSKGLSGFEA